MTDLQDELVLLDPGNVEMYSLKAVGRCVWQALPASTSEAARQVALHFTVSEAEAQQDVQALLDDLLQAGLVTADSPAAAGG